LQAHNLARLAPILSRYEKPSIAFWLGDASGGAITHRSKLGGLPLLPPGFEWPRKAATGVNGNPRMYEDCAVRARCNWLGAPTC